jgi:paraquat-inducible protein B
LAKRISPTLVGAFVLASFLLLVAGLLYLGGGDWFADKRRFVIYFDNAIKGLTVGAPVTFKGVPVGRVTSLKVHYNQETGTTEIPVLIDIDPAKMVTLDQREGLPAKLLQEMIAQGLRAQINPESLITNQQVVQLDFFPNTKARLVESHLPYPQIPSLPSAFDQLQASLGNTAQTLPELAAAATVALNQVSVLLSPANQQKVAHILENIDGVTGQLASHGADLGKTLVSLQQSSEELNHLLKGLDQTIAENRQPVGEAVAKIGQTAESVHQLTDQLNAILAEDRAAIQDFSNGSLYDLAGLIADSRTMVRRATDTLDQLNRDPSRFLFGSGEQGIPAK